MKGLILGRGTAFPVHRQMRQERFDFGLGHRCRVAFAVVEDELLGPLHVGLLGADRIVAQPAGVLDLIEQLGFLAAGYWLRVRVHSAFVGFVTPSAT